MALAKEVADASEELLAMAERIDHGLGPIHGTAITDRLAVLLRAAHAQSELHDRRVAELLAANNREVERRRAAETAAIAVTKALLDEFYTPHEADLWLISPHPQLDGKSAEQAILAGDVDCVLQVIARIRDEVYL